MNQCIKFCLLTSCFISTPSNVIFAQQNGDTQASVKSIWDARSRSIESAVVEWEDSVTTAAGAFTDESKSGGQSAKKILPDKDTVTINKFNLTISNGMTRVEENGYIWDATKDDFTGLSRINAQDGSNETALSTVNGITRGYIYNMKMNRGTGASSWPVRVTLRGTDRFIMNKMDLSEYTNVSLLDSAQMMTTLVSPRNESQGEYNLTLTGNNYLPKRLEQFSRNGTLTLKIVINSYRPFQNGLSLPENWTTTVYMGGGLMLETKSRLIKAEFNINCPKSLFRLDFPVGTVVSDQTKENSRSRDYVITKSGSNVPVTKKFLPITKEKVDEIVAIEQPLTEKTNWRLIILYCLCILTAIGFVLLAYRSRNRSA